MTDSSSASSELSRLVEQLAAVEHQRWAHWQKYMHEQCEHLPDGRLIVPADLVQRWEKQIDTPYDRLSDEEKASDRAQVERVLPILAEFLPTAMRDNV